MKQFESVYLGEEEYSLTFDGCTDLAFKVWTGLRDIARARPDEIATREIRGSA